MVGNPIQLSYLRHCACQENWLIDHVSEQMNLWLMVMDMPKLHVCWLRSNHLQFWPCWMDSNSTSWRLMTAWKMYWHFFLAYLCQPCEVVSWLVFLVVLLIFWLDELHLDLVFDVYKHSDLRLMVNRWLHDPDCYQCHHHCLFLDVFVSTLVLKDHSDPLVVQQRRWPPDALRVDWCHEVLSDQVY